MSKTRAVSRELSGATALGICEVLCVIIVLLALCCVIMPSFTRVRGVRYAPACLLRDLSHERTSKDVEEVLREMVAESATASRLLEKVIIVDLAPDVAERWMKVTFQEQDGPPTDWTVEGQIISDDRLGSLESVMFVPRSVTNSGDMDGRGISPSSAKKGWDMLRPDLELLAEEAVKAVGTRRGWTMPATSGDNPLVSPEAHSADKEKTASTSPTDP